MKPCFLLCILTLTWAACDITPPELGGMAITLNTEMRSLRIFYNVTDDQSGVAHSSFAFSGAGTSTLLCRGAGDEDFADCLIYDSPSGVFTLDAVAVVDKVGNVLVYGKSLLVGYEEGNVPTESIPAFASGITFTSPEIAPRMPALLRYEFEATVNITEAVVLATSVWISSPGGFNSTVVRFGDTYELVLWPSDRVAGNELNGSYAGSITLRPGQHTGEYLISIAASDVVGNVKTYDSASGLGPASLIVVGPAVDVVPPQISSVVLEPEGVNSTLTAPKVRVVVHAEDDYSGVASVSVALCRAMWGVSPPLCPDTPAVIPVRTIRVEATLRSGSMHNGTFEAIIQLPEGTPAGEYLFDRTHGIRTRDFAGNLNALGAAAIASRYGTAHISVACAGPPLPVPPTPTPPPPPPPDSKPAVPVVVFIVGLASAAVVMAMSIRYAVVWSRKDPMEEEERIGEGVGLLTSARTLR